MGDSGSSPRVSAVVTAHTRTTFLSAAVQSALESGADEVVVVRNFAGPIPGCEGQYRDVQCAAPETNEKQARGLEASTGEVVGFLDDDDLWEPSKVAHLRTLFGGRPELVYYNHGHRPVDESGHPVIARHRELAGKDPGAFPAWDGQDFETFVHRIWPGTHSSTVVRKAWAVEWLPAFRQAGWTADMFWLVAALLSRRPMEIGAEPLTLLRLHQQNMSQTRGAAPEEFRRRHQETSERFARSTAVLAQLAAQRAGPSASVTRYLAQRAEGYRFFACLEAGAQPRRSALRALRRGPGLADRGVWGTAMVALVTPAGARRLLFRSSLRRWALG